MTYEFAPDELTGQLVMELRSRHKLSRAQFSERAGFLGRSTARLSNIELKDSWKPGDREAIAQVLTDLVGDRFDPRYHTPHEPTPPKPAQPTTVSVVMIEDDDEPADDDHVVDVKPRYVEPVITLPLYVAPTTPEVNLAAQDDGTYRISNGENSTWKRCRRKWWLGWYQGLKLKTEDYTSVRAIGTRVHRALERWYAPEGQLRVDPRDALERVIVEDWTTISTMANQQGVNEDYFKSLAKSFADATNLERAMVEGYVQWLEETGADADLRVIASETSLTAELEVEVNGEVRPVRAIGLMDVRVSRTTDNRNLFLDHKTVGDLKSPAVTLPLNEQMLHYNMLEWLNTPEGEQRCDGALYNMLRRVKRSQQAKPPFYARIEVHHNIIELESYKRRLLASTRDIITAVEALDRGDSHLDVAYPTPKPACSWDCDFFAVCGLFDDGSPGVDNMLSVLYEKYDPRDRYERTDSRNGE